MFWWMEKHVQSTLRRGLERTDPLHLSVCENIGKVKVLLCTHPMHLQLPLQRLGPSADHMNETKRRVSLAKLNSIQTIIMMKYHLRSILARPMAE
jgi:hypothetical protein